MHSFICSFTHNCSIKVEKFKFDYSENVWSCFLFLAYPPEELNGFHTTTKPSTVNIRLLLLLPVHMNLIKNSCYAFWLSKKYKFHFIGGLALRIAGLQRNSRIKKH